MLTRGPHPPISLRFMNGRKQKLNLILHLTHLFAHGSNKQRLKVIHSLTCLSSLNAQTPSFLSVIMHPAPWPFFLFVKSYLLLSTILSRPTISTGSLLIPLFNFFSALSLQIPSYSCTSLLIDKTYIWYLEVCACSGFEAVQMCQDCILMKIGFFFPQAGLPFETFSSVFPMTVQRRGPSSSAPISRLDSVWLFTNEYNQYSPHFAHLLAFSSCRSSL